MKKLVLLILCAGCGLPEDFEDTGPGVDRAALTKELEETPDEPAGTAEQKADAGRPGGGSGPYLKVELDNTLISSW